MKKVLMAVLVLLGTAFILGMTACSNNVSDASGGGSVGASENNGSQQTQFAVTLENFDAAKKIPVIHAVKALTGLGLGEAKALVEGAPRVIIEGLSEAEADKWIADITAAGGMASKR